MLYLVAEAADGWRDFEQIAERVSGEFGRRVTADNVRFLVEEKLRPLGVLAPAEGETVEVRRAAESLLGLRYRLDVLSAGLVRTITFPFLFLFWPPAIVVILGGLVAFDAWLFFVHGLSEGLLEVIYQPYITIGFLVVELVAMSWHELGHATACRYGGARPGKVGIGIYVIWFVFYSDVTDSYRLSKGGRLRTDFGGIYFDMVFTMMLVGVYLLTGYEPLLVLILLNQLAISDELSPFLRFDGYYIMSDLTGVPDLFKSIKPIAKSLVPGWGADENVQGLKPWVRVVVTVWVLMVIPSLAIGAVVLIYYGPWFVANAWNSFWINYSEVLGAYEDGRVLDGFLAVVNVLTLVVPVVGGTLIFALVSTTLGVRAWHWLAGKLLLHPVGFVIAAVAAAAVSAVAGAAVATILLVWLPDWSSVGLLSLVVLVVSGILILAWIINNWGRRAWRWSEGRPLRRLAFGTAAGGVVLAVMLLLGLAAQW